MLANGNSSIIADRLALKLADVVVTESGFGADIGMEKFLDIKCRASGLFPDVAVLVATVRALKMHGGGPPVLPGKPLPLVYMREDLRLLVAGLPNLMHHLGIVRRFGIPAVVAVNRFLEDTPSELDEVCRAARSAGAVAVVADHWERGGEGATDLADAVSEAWCTEKKSKFLYPLDVPLREKIEIIAREIYGAGDVCYSEQAVKDLERCEELGYGTLPVCMSKTHLSLSHDASLKGAPRGFTLPVREVRISAGAGFVYPLCGSMQTMPGLPARPAFMNVDLDPEGNVRGIS
jgi:formyltetrahydrofolate synthetase